MIRRLFLRLWKKALPRKPVEPRTTKAAEPSPYTDEEARKVKERLQGLGYID